MIPAGDWKPSSIPLLKSPPWLFGEPRFDRVLCDQVPKSAVGPEIDCRDRTRQPLPRRKPSLDVFEKLGRDEFYSSPRAHRCRRNDQPFPSRVVGPATWGGRHMAPL